MRSAACAIGMGELGSMLQVRRLKLGMRWQRSERRWQRSRPSCHAHPAAAVAHLKRLHLFLPAAGGSCCRGAVPAVHLPSKLQLVQAGALQAMRGTQ